MATWAERYPRPTRPEPPADDRPVAEEDFHGWNKWVRTKEVWNEYCRQLRRHRVAVAVDELLRTRVPGLDELPPAGAILLATGLNLLDTNLVMSEDG